MIYYGIYIYYMCIIYIHHVPVPFQSHHCCITCYLQGTLHPAPRRLKCRKRVKIHRRNHCPEANDGSYQGLNLRAGPWEFYAMLLPQKFKLLYVFLKIVWFWRRSASCSISRCTQCTQCTPQRHLKIWFSKLETPRATKNLPSNTWSHLTPTPVRHLCSHCEHQSVQLLAIFNLRLVVLARLGSKALVDDN